MTPAEDSTVLPAEAASELPVERPSTWRRLALPVGVIAIILCLVGAAAFMAGP